MKLQERKNYDLDLSQEIGINNYPNRLDDFLNDFLVKKPKCYIEEFTEQEKKNFRLLKIDPTPHVGFHYNNRGIILSRKLAEQLIKISQNE